LPTLLTWAAEVLGAPIQSAESLRVREASPWKLTTHDGRAALLKTAPDGDPAFLATEAAAMRLCAEHDIPAPKLLGLETHALLRSILEGSNDVPLEPSSTRLQRLGAAAARSYRVRITPTETLPLRHRHMFWKDLATERRTGEEPTTALLDEADAALQQHAAPDDELGLVHGDLWAGNTIWNGDEYIGTIDWDAAGAGSYGVDLGSLRLDTALFHGVEAIDDVLAGWEDEAGRRAENVAYWDVVAALNVEADTSGSVPAMHETGRTDLDGETMNGRRDEFLEDALRRLRG
jgi:aminoglycoside phosphotransferase (APT) family kinase protein